MSDNLSPVDTDRITGERLNLWREHLKTLHATPALMLAVGHDHRSGEVHVFILENMPTDMLKQFLMKAYRKLDEEQIELGRPKEG